MLVSGLTANAAANDFTDIPLEWTTQPITVDGQMGDWSDLSTRFLGEPKAVVGLACDSTHLYLILRFQDNHWARMIMGTGLKLWLDPEGKKNEIFMVKFRGGPTQEQMQLLSGDTGDRDGRATNGGMFPGDRPAGDKRLFTCAIKDRIELKSIPASGTEGPQASFGLDRGFFVYEFAIPLDEGGVRYYGLGVSPGDEISIGVFWGDMNAMGQRGDRPGGGTPGGGRGGGRGGGGGMGGKGGGQPGGRGGMGGNRPERPQPIEFWIEAKLAEQVESQTD